jgi:hypothetical protein
VQNVVASSRFGDDLEAVDMLGKNALGEMMEQRDGIIVGLAAEGSRGTIPFGGSACAASGFFVTRSKFAGVWGQIR